VSSAMQILDELRRQGVIPTGISADSRRVAPGDLFVAIPGARSDGRAYIEEAVARGAAGVLWEAAGIGDSELPIAVPNIAVTGLPALSGELAHLVYGRPSEKLWMVGVTGTNGKTSVSQWIAQAFELLGRKCGIVGTLGNGFPGELKESSNTTPDAISVHRTLAGFVAAGADACAMEVSSIGLDQGRTNAVAFDVAVFTNLTRDHLEYHGNMAAYGAAKARLFDVAGLKSAVLNLDDAFGARLGTHLAGKGVRRIGYSLSGNPGGYADEMLNAENLGIGGDGLIFNVRTPHGAARISAPLLGRFNAANLLAVLGALLAADVPLARAAAVLPQLVAPPGRMQTVGGKDEPLLVVDYAHTPDALEQVLTTLREVSAARGNNGGNSGDNAGRLICVFGCGGERDPGKRPLMGEAVARLADWAIVTSDNPRGENPQAIIADILRGMSAAATVEPDRASAIRKAVLGANRHDVVLIAGKGHEPTQEIAGRRLPFSDLEQARAALAAWRATA